jgi:hypothetical protein
MDDKKHENDTKGDLTYSGRTKRIACSGFLGTAPHTMLTAPCPTTSTMSEPAMARVSLQLRCLLHPRLRFC